VRVILPLLLGVFVAFAQSARSTGIVAPNDAEFTIPLEQPANATWFWNRPETVTINTRALGENFEIVKVKYRN
jgi:hypothetical protein